MRSALITQTSLELPTTLRPGRSHSPPRCSRRFSCVKIRFRPLLTAASKESRCFLLFSGGQVVKNDACN